MEIRSSFHDSLILSSVRLAGCKRLSRKGHRAATRTRPWNLRYQLQCDSFPPGTVAGTTPGAAIRPNSFDPQCTTSKRASQVPPHNERRHISGVLLRRLPGRAGWLLDEGIHPCPPSYAATPTGACRLTNSRRIHKHKGESPQPDEKLRATQADTRDARRHGNHTSIHRCGHPT